MPDGSDDSHNTIARERDLQVSQMMPDAKAIKDGAALIRTGQQLQAAAKSDEFFDSVVPEYSKRLLKKVIGEMGGLDLGTMTQHLAHGRFSRGRQVQDGTEPERGDGRDQTESRHRGCQCSAPSR